MSRENEASLILQAAILPESGWRYPSEQIWLAEEAGTPVGFAGAVMWGPDQCAYLTRAGVTPSARGHGLQRRLIRARVRWAREQGARGVYTYTSREGIYSANNLIREGFTLWTPARPWGLAGALYWWREL